MVFAAWQRNALKIPLIFLQNSLPIISLNKHITLSQFKKTKQRYFKGTIPQVVSCDFCVYTTKHWCIVTIPLHRYLVFILVLYSYTDSLFFDLVQNNTRSLCTFSRSTLYVYQLHFFGVFCITLPYEYNQILTIVFC